MRRLISALACGLLVTTCASPEADEPAGADVADSLAQSLEVGVGRDEVRLALRLTNMVDTAVVLEFATAQRYDFEIRTLSGEVVWRWSADQGFAQMLGEERLAAGESVQYEAMWPGGEPGEYVAVGRLTSSSNPIELRTEFEIPVP